MNNKRKALGNLFGYKIFFFEKKFLEPCTYILYKLRGK